MSTNNMKVTTTTTIQATVEGESFGATSEFAEQGALVFARMIFRRDVARVLGITPLAVDGYNIEEVENLTNSVQFNGYTYIAKRESIWQYTDVKGN